MLGQLELDRRARRISGRLEPLGALARSSKRSVLPHPTVPILAAYLVERTRVDEFVRLVSRLEERLEEVTLLPSGPWPPYSFAQGSPA
jgi:hypothetical protein